MALQVEGVLNGGVHTEKTLGGVSRLEPLHFALALSHCLMRVFRPIVIPQPLLLRADQSFAIPEFARLAGGGSGIRNLSPLEDRANSPG